MDTTHTNSLSIEYLQARARALSTARVISTTSNLLPSRVQHSTEKLQYIYETPERRQKETGSLIPAGYDDFWSSTSIKKPGHVAISRPALKP